ncbi:MAG: dynamin family protein [Selenomonadaceae bacterium]|nr:dynamin family protein [Selenomonadaceae bacterium]
MSDWEESKQNFIDKLKKADVMFDEIFKVDRDELVIQGNEREDLKTLQAANKKILKKLESREFTVAIVGLEKAGKSTLGNALIKSMVLPEYAQRCTYTTTEIRSGKVDIAEVYFYSRDEFNKNFKRMLNDVQYGDAADFFSMTLEAFNSYWRAVETDPAKFGIFHLHNASTAADIKEMLGGKAKLIPLLGREKITFGAEYWNADDKFNEFKKYITGMAGKNPDGSVIREPYPYAVKNVIIRSTQLDDMSHMVLYDVPGFDSPTELHKRQTEEMLKESDAIILVTNVGDRPDLVGTQLDMLRKGQDNDGIKLSAKAFVFGNKIDSAPDLSTAKGNFAALRNGSVDNQIALAEHIVCGSARAYLEKLGFIAGNFSSQRIDEWQLPNGDGIEFLRKNMQNYYDNERFEVLRRRAETTLSKTKSVLQNLLDRYNSGELNYSDAGAEIFMEMQSNYKLFKKESATVTKAHTDKILRERPFTCSLKDDVEKIFPLINDAYAQLIIDEEKALSIDPDGVYQTSKVDGNVRDKLGKIFIENIVISASRFTLERQAELRQALVNLFLEIMGIEQGTIYRTELEKSVNEMFNKMLIKDGTTCNFNSLVERFITTLIQTLISNPFAAEERLNKVKETLEELVSLAVYYNMPTDKAERNTLRLNTLEDDCFTFFEKILAHEGIDTGAEVDFGENEKVFRKIFKENEDQICKGAPIEINSLPFDKWAKLLKKAGIDLSESNKLEDKLEDLFYCYDSKNNWTRFSAEQKVKAIEKVINTYAHGNLQSSADNEPHTLQSQLDDIQRRAKNFNVMGGKDDMIATLDTDILILRDITRRAVINAIGLERAFVSVVTKNVELIREHLDEGDGAKTFRAWIRKNAAMLQPSRFGEIIEQGAIRENQKAIVNAVKKVLDNWN